MDYRRFLAASAAVSLMVAACSCGDKHEKTEKNNTSAVQEETSVTEKNVTASTAENTTEKSTETTSAESKKKSEKATSSTTGNSAKTTASSKKNSTTTVSEASGGSSSESGGNSSSQTGGDMGSKEKPQTSEETSENEYTAEITMGSSPKIKGENVTAEGNIVTITAGGDYLVSGSTDNGQLRVCTDTEEKVKVVLDGVDIANESGPAIFIDEAKKCTVELLDGTTSVLKDGAKDKINDGVIFSNDTLRIKGGGELCIYSNNAHGIASDDDVIIEDGIFEINSIKSGIFAHDDITVNGGELTVFGGTNGLKSKGTININGGRCVISGGTKEEKSSVYAGAALNYTGGSLFAAGNQVTTPSTSVNPFVVVDLGGSYDADSTVEMLLDSTQMVSFQPHNNFRCLMMLTPEIGVGSSYKTIIDGKEGKEFTLSDGQNLVTFE